VSPDRFGCNAGYADPLAATALSGLQHDGGRCDAQVVCDEAKEGLVGGAFDRCRGYSRQKLGIRADTLDSIRAPAGREANVELSGSLHLTDQPSGAGRRASGSIVTTIAW
jgi:hypothetical protein